MSKLHFLPEPIDGFYNTLKHRVFVHFRENKLSRYANARAIIKTLLFTTIFIQLYFIILFLPLPYYLFLLAWFFMGIFLILAAMSMVHDAAHGVYSKHALINEALLLFANLAGGDGYMYKFKHTMSHHPFTNIHGLDIDLEQSSLVRVTPYTKSKEKHKHQAKYMKILYPFFILFWVLLRDFKYYRLEKIGLTKTHHAPIRWIVLIASKIFYILYMIIIPCWLLPYEIAFTLAGFVCMHIGSGVVAMFALLSNHVVEDSVFITPGKNGIIDCSWGEHQMRTTDDYSPDSKVISYLFSGLNHHVAHHLFPRYCHVHYPVITKIVRETAAEFGIRYRYNSITDGLVSHFKLLKRLSKQKQAVPAPYGN